MPDLDDSLPHQIRILADRDNRNRQRVSCTCLYIKAKMGRGRPRYEYMEEVPKDAEDSIRIYNNPLNHNPEAEAFGTELPTDPTEWEGLRAVT